MIREESNQFAVPLALSFARTRRRLFHRYAKALKNGLERQRKPPIGETYFDLPAEASTDTAPNISPTLKPLDTILRFICENNGEGCIVLIEGPGGVGKTALLHAVTRALLKLFKRVPDAPLPVNLAPSKDSLETRLGAELGSGLVGDTALKIHLESGHLLVIMDSVSEAGMDEQATEQLFKAKELEHVTLLLTSRPNPASTLRRQVESSANWMVVTPQGLDDQTFPRFVAHYGREALSVPLAKACRGMDKRYLPLLVRLAMKLQQEGQTASSPVEIYDEHFKCLLQGQIPDPQKKLGKMSEAYAWAVGSYWVNGLRTVDYDKEASPLEELLLECGLLVAVGPGNPPPKVRLFHDSMQTYLTAKGLAELERKKYVGMPDIPTGQPQGTGAWTRSEVLLRAATYKRFTAATSELVGTGGGELFEMCLLTFAPADEMREWLRDELNRWAKVHHEDISRFRAKAALKQRGTAAAETTKDLINAATFAAFQTDQSAGGVTNLGAVYAAIAPLIEEIPAPTAVRPTSQ